MSIAFPDIIIGSCRIGVSFSLQVMPILKLLYNADDHNAHHIYMSLIILLILSQDDNFNKSVHELVGVNEICCGLLIAVFILLGVILAILLCFRCSKKRNTQNFNFESNPRSGNEIALGRGYLTTIRSANTSKCQQT